MLNKMKHHLIFRPIPPANILSMFSPPFPATAAQQQEIRDYAAKLGEDEAVARQKGMEEKLVGFRGGGGEVYR